jgi:hypothetical protein
MVTFPTSLRARYSAIDAPSSMPGFTETSDEAFAEAVPQGAVWKASSCPEVTTTTLT